MIGFLQPSLVKNKFDSIEIDGTIGKTVMAVGFPRKIRDGWLDGVFATGISADISMHIVPSNIDSVMSHLNRELVKQESDMLSAKNSGIVNPSLRIQHSDTMKVLEKLQKGEEKLFTFALYVNAQAQEKHALESAAAKICSELNSMMIIPKTPYFRMLDAFRSIAPLQTDRLCATRNITSSGLSACFPFTTRFLKNQSEGILLGVSQKNKLPVIIDPFAMANHNGLILGTSGSGKSVAAKIFIMRATLCGVRCIIIDPQGEYAKLVAKCGGENIRIAKGSASTLNPFDLMGMGPHEKMQQLAEFFELLIGPLEREERNLILKCVHSAYETKGIREENPKSHRNAPPIFLEFSNEIRKLKPSDREEAKARESVLSSLMPFTRGGYSFLDSRTRLDFGKTVVSFDISAIPEKIKPAVMLLALQFAHSRMKNDNGKKLLVLDEAWSLLRHSGSGEQVFSMVKTARKFGMGVLVITQEVSDLLGSDAGRAIAANASWKFLARQEPAATQSVAQNFMLNEKEKQMLMTAQQGEGLLIAMNEHYPLKVLCSEKEYKIVTTKFDEN